MSHETKQRRRLTRGQVARRFGVTTRTLRRWEKRPELGFHKVIIMNGRGYLDEDEIEAYALAQVKVAASRALPAAQPADGKHIMPDDRGIAHAQAETVA
jgi:MerR HTH family regulatory protein